MTQLPGFQPRPPRLFRADQILNGQVRLDGYPFPHIAVRSCAFLRAGG